MEIVKMVKTQFCWQLQVVDKQSSREKVAVTTSSLKPTAGNAAAINAMNGTASARQQYGMRPSNSSSFATPSRVPSANTRYC